MVDVPAALRVKNPLLTKNLRISQNYDITLWLFKIYGSQGPFIDEHDDLPVSNGDFP